MEQILNKLSEIEATANAIMQDAARQKKALSEEAEKQTREFDAALEKETGTFAQKPNTSCPGWTPITKPITKVFAVSCFRK